MTLDDILLEIKKAGTIVLLTHEVPDGDAIGSSLAMYNALKNLNKKVDIVIPEVPRIYNFLPGYKDIKEKGTLKKYDLAISLDCATLKRLNGFESDFENAKTKIMIDHHNANDMFGDLNYVNADAPACAQILMNMFEYYNVEISKDIATCLLVGIITDTGGFKYSSVKPETFDFVAELLRKGINVSDIYKRVLDTKTKPNFELTKLVMQRLEFIENGKIAFTYITQEDEENAGAKSGDHEGLVNIGRDIEGVEVSIFLRQKDGIFRASLRSNEYVNVSDVCIIFGGGGHIRAAGTNIMGTLEEVKEKIIKEVKKYLK